LFPKQAANSLVTETSQYFVFFCRSVCSAILAKCLIINDLRLILVILFFIAFLNITYMSRHSFASVIALANNVSLPNVAKMLGHSSTRMTTYLKPFRNKKIDEANKKVVDFIKRSIPIAMY